MDVARAEGLRGICRAGTAVGVPESKGAPTSEAISVGLGAGPFLLPPVSSPLLPHSSETPSLFPHPFHPATRATYPRLEEKIKET